ncbi:MULTISPECIES: hypothetical protein [Curtobacterium]|uniref:hypothetical protein n=1 Tax=Curtobacterium TaxID=2034 RepID=UPI00217ED8F9|nr:hypothetical protein [Curtobacterium flaccumfaciens]MCS6562296.1 hypothetical protein [Curtobacterium flaccumfaciens pv. poinsettiae]UXN28365.1 hypothetical protein N8D75_15400 [Curtobacterium flaccumfaciens]
MLNGTENTTRPVLMLESGRKRKIFRGLLIAVQTAAALGVDEVELARMPGTGTGPAAFVMTPRIVRYAPTAIATWKAANGR